jgi:serine/threonine protein kinase
VFTVCCGSLAARNVLLARDLTAKVADFGFARLLNGKGAGATATNSGPLKWMAPECITLKQYSGKSDVWSFGVTMVEILTHDAPYPGEEGINVVIGVTTQGRTPEIPANCPLALGEIMRSCWAFEPTNRPDFSGIHASLAQLR